MGYHSFKTYVKTCVKYVLFFIFLINLVSTAHADTGRLVHYNWTEDNGNTIIDNSGHGNDGINNGTTTFILSTGGTRSEEHTSELQSRENLVCRLLLEKKNISSHIAESQRR